MRPVEEYLKPEVIQQVARLDLKARFIVEGFISGLHDSPYYGFSSEFSEHRKYTIGDELKHIDWNVFARTDKLYIKRFEAETNLDCHILLDASESMAYSHGRTGRSGPAGGSGPTISKLEYAIYMAAALGYLMINQQDNLGLITFDEELTHVVPARSKRSHLVAVLGVLAGSMRHRPSRLSVCLHRAADMLRKRGLVILFSDLIPAEGEDQEAVLDGMRHIKYRGHDLICFQVLDHAELTFPFSGPARFIDVESQQPTQADADAVAEAYRREMAAFVARYRSVCLDEGMDFMQVDTVESFDTALLEYLRTRQTKF